MSIAPDTAHFARAVTEFGERRPVVSRTAIFNVQGLKIIDKGVAINSRLYERLTQHQLKLPLSDCVDTELLVSGPLLRDAAHLLLGQDPLLGAMFGDASLRERMLDESALVPLPQPVAFQLTVLRETQPDAWQHALRSMVVATWLAARQGGGRYDMRLLAVAGLVHDLGMLHVDPVLRQPEVELSAEQRRHLYSHSLVTVMLLEKHHEFPRELLRAVMEHHETLDGGGYPRHVTGAGISAWGRVLSLTEVVTSVYLPDRPASAARLSLVLRMNRHRYDAALAQEILAVLPPPPGTRTPPPAVAQGDDAVSALAAIERSLAACPAEMPGGAASAAARELYSQCAQVQRNLADAGAAAEQLAQLGAGGLDDVLSAELALIAREAAWQLRSVVRQARRRFRAAGSDGTPPAFRSWLEEADALCARHLSVKT